MERVKLGKELELSRIVHGHWRLTDWQLSNQELLKLTEQVRDLGIDSFDHADIYGNYKCEAAFGNALALKKELRSSIKIITKCGIKMLSDVYPERKVKHYDYSYNAIIQSVEASLKNLQTDYIDLLLLHRPAPFFNPTEVAKAFNKLKQSGKVLNFGVSNFTPQQYDMLDSYLSDKLVTNQIELSPYCLEHFENANLEFLLQKRIHPMAWSPLAGGKLFKPQSTKGKQLSETLQEVANELNVNGIDQIAYAWLMKHPAGILPIVGSGNIERVKAAIASMQIEMNLEQWYKIYTASKGEELP